MIFSFSTSRRRRNSNRDSTYNKRKFYSKYNLA